MSRSMSTTGPTKGPPPWAADFIGRDHMMPGGAKLLASAFLAADGVTVVIGAAGAAANDTSIPVDALTGAVPDNFLLDFGGKKFARVNGAAAAAAVTITVDAIPTALVDNDAAIYPGIVKPKTVPSGTLIGRTIAERNASTPFGPWASGDDEVFLTAFDVIDVDSINDVELYRPGSVVKENFLPGYAALTAGQLAALRAAYKCVRGAE